MQFHRSIFCSLALSGLKMSHTFVRLRQSARWLFLEPHFLKMAFFKGCGFYGSKWLFFKIPPKHWKFMSRIWKYFLSLQIYKFCVSNTQMFIQTSPRGVVGGGVIYDARGGHIWCSLMCGGGDGDISPDAYSWFLE